MLVRRFAITVTGIILLTPAAHAAPSDRPQHRPPAVNARQHRQVARISHGVKNDEITAAEANRLKAGQAAIRAEERVYRLSGDGLTKREVKDLQKDLNAASRGIYRAPHNGRDHSDTK